MCPSEDTVAARPESAAPRPRPRRITLVLICVAVLSMALAAVSAWNRTPWSDEGQFSSAAYNLAHRGFFGTTVLEPATMGLTRIQQRTYWVLPLYLLGQTLWYKVAPASLFWTRAFSILWAPLALFAFYRLLRQLFADPRVPAAATALLAFDYYFIDNAGFARPEMMCLALGFGGLAIYVSLRDRSLRAALFWGNLPLAAAALTHPNAILYMAGFVLLVAWFDLRRIRAFEIAAAAPYVLLGSLYGLYILQDPAAWADQMRANGTNGRLAATLNPLRILRNEIVERYLVAYGFATGKAALLKSVSIVSFAAALAGIACTAALRRNGAVRLLLALLAVFFAIQSIFNQKLSYYLVHILPLYIALFAAWLVWTWERAPKLRPALATWMVLLMTVPAAGILLRARQRSYAAAEAAALQFLNTHAANARSIVGTAALIYGMHFDDRLRDDILLGARTASRPDVIVMTPLYDEAYTGWDKTRPADWRAVTGRLAEYRLVYNESGYRIYERGGDSLQNSAHGVRVSPLRN